MDTSPSPSPRRPTAITIPSLHLGSFEGLSPESYPLPPSPSRIASTYNNSSGPTQGTSGHPDTNRVDAQTRVNGQMDYSSNVVGVGSSSRLPTSHSSDHRQDSNGQHRLSQSSSSLTASSTRSPSRPRHFVNPPALPPPTMSLPPLPTISPISPMHPPSSSPNDAMNLFASTSTTKTSMPNTASASQRLRLPTPPSLSSSRPSTAPSLSSTSSSSPSGPRSPADSNKVVRPLGPSLTIHIPRKETPLSSLHTFDDVPALVRDSPSIARRRTVIEANPALSHVSPVRMSQVLNLDVESASPTEYRPLQEFNPRTSSLELGSLVMPVARPTPPVDTHPAQFPAPSPRRLEKKQSTNDLKNASPTSPTPRRSLPRPPSAVRSSQPPPPPLVLNPISTLPPSTSHPPRTDSMRPQSTLMPVTTTSRAPPTTLDKPLKSPDLPQVLPPSRHHPTKSASSMPVVAGLADSGPYPTAAPAPYRSRQAAANAGPSGVGMGRPTASQPAKRPPPQEEVCIECMMRDRDLADVIVSGEGVWERRSDFDWEDMKAREDELLRSLGSGSVMSSSIPSLDHSTGSDEEDSTSLPSTNHSFEEIEARRKAVARNAKREQKRARRREIDWRIVKECGWRGFKWEEGQKGEGLPRGFRGGRGGPLTEEGIKAIMTKFPSASAHRAKWLDNYLYHQAILVREIRAEAKRTGHYPEPGEVPVSTATNVVSPDGQSIIAGPRTSSVAWGAKHARELSEQMRGAFDSPAQPHPNPPHVTVRPSPSSPADLASLAKRPQPPPLNRPLTQLYPERELAPQRSPISAASLREQQRKSVSSAKTLDRSLRTADDWHDNDSEIWPPVSPGESGLRPFSFAVRAGAAGGSGGRGSSDGHGRRSFLGRWGGSVTSFFGGSHNGSGSMMDMHLGLDNERQNRTMSSYVHSQPRAVSLASPTRPAFFDRASRASSINGDTGGEKVRRIGTSLSASRLSQMLGDESEDQPLPTEKKKGFKGFFKKMKPKSGHKKELSRNSRPVEPSPRIRMDEQSDLGVPLALPPPMSYLAGRGEGQQNRDRSGSTSTNLTDSSSAVASRGPAVVLPYGMRSVSAPQAGSSSGGSQSASPTSSRYNRRESYTSGRDLSDIDRVDRDRRGSAMEMLAGRPLMASPEGEELQSVHPSRNQQHHVATYPPPTFRPHNKTTSSLSNSSLLMPTVETPPPGVNGAYAFFPPSGGHTQNGKVNMNQNVNTSPNRYKNLPPLPPPGQDGGGGALSLSTSPISLNDPDPYEPYSFSTTPQPHLLQDFAHRGERRASGAYQNGSGYIGQTTASTTGTFGSPREQGSYTQPRSSFDPHGDRPNPRQQLENQRNARSMYVHPSTGQVGSFGMAPDRVGGYPMETVGSVNSMKSQGSADTRNGSKGKKGLKGFFGSARAGRVA